MKKIMCLLIGILILTGCSSKELKGYYDNMQIGDSVESYRMKLSVYGKVKGKNIDSISSTISNYKGLKYTVETNDNNYYIEGNKVYKSSQENKLNDKFNFKDIMEENTDVTYTITEEKIYHDTNEVLSGLINCKDVKEGTNDIPNTDFKLYNFNLNKGYVKDLLSHLGLDSDFEKATGKLYLDNDRVYKIEYKIDELTVLSFYSKMNRIDDFNIKIGE